MKKLVQMDYYNFQSAVWVALSDEAQNKGVLVAL